MNKRQIVDAIIAKLESDLKTLIQANKAALDEATHEESKPENEYDTRALETGYLVKAQSKRILEAKETLAAFRHFTFEDFKPDEAIRSTALFQLDMNGKEKWFLYMNLGGGVSVQVGGESIQVITPASPLGESLLGLKVGDLAVVESGKDRKEYEVLSLV